jgi:hypothetical protein
VGAGSAENLSSCEVLLAHIPASRYNSSFGVAMPLPAPLLLPLNLEVIVLCFQSVDRSLPCVGVPARSEKLSAGQKGRLPIWARTNAHMCANVCTAHFVWWHGTTIHALTYLCPCHSVLYRAFSCKLQFRSLIWNSPSTSHRQRCIWILLLLLRQVSLHSRFLCPMTKRVRPHSPESDHRKQIVHKACVQVPLLVKAGHKSQLYKRLRMYL